MSALLIAAFQALPVYFVGIATRSMGALWIITIIMVLIAVSTGNKNYDYLDLIAIGIAFVVAGSSMRR